VIAFARWDPLAVLVAAAIWAVGVLPTDKTTGCPTAPAALSAVSAASLTEFISRARKDAASSAVFEA
jgi:hypothetical protein